MKRTLAQHLDPNVGPKRILSMDGGGIRGALSLGYLKKLETLLRKQENDPNLLLCDYFDLIGGTSTGSIIAASLAIGKSVDELTDLYMDLGGKIFGKKNDWWNPLETMKFLKAAYDYSALETSLKNVFGDMTLGSDAIKTGLCIVSKRADTNSTWPLINHPAGKYFDSAIGKNKDIPVWKAIRASSAAPTYFVPQVIDVGDNEQAAFVDGAVSPANNPALNILMVATLKGFPFGWKMGEKNLSLVSIGTGYGVYDKKTDEIEDAWLATWALSIPDMLMADTSWQNQIVLQWLSNSPNAHIMDAEMGALNGDYLGDRAQIKYLRYDFPITADALNSLNLGQQFEKKDEAKIIDMCAADNRQLLLKIGVSDAERNMKPNHIAYL